MGRASFLTGIQLELSPTHTCFPQGLCDSLLGIQAPHLAQLKGSSLPSTRNHWIHSLSAKKAQFLPAG